MDGQCALNFSCSSALHYHISKTQAMNRSKRSTIYEMEDQMLELLLLQILISLLIQLL